MSQWYANCSWFIVNYGEVDRAGPEPLRRRKRGLAVQLEVIHPNRLRRESNASVSSTAMPERTNSMPERIVAEVAA